MAYDYWLFQLERLTGIEFNTSPARLLIGCVVISAGPALMVGAVLDTLIPASGGGWMIGLGLLGFCVGAVSGRMEAGPAVGWFDAPPDSHRFRGERPGYLELGEDE